MKQVYIQQSFTSDPTKIHLVWVVYTIDKSVYREFQLAEEEDAKKYQQEQQLILNKHDKR